MKYKLLRILIVFLCGFYFSVTYNLKAIEIIALGLMFGLYGIVCFFGGINK